jgi:hypothetical protein
MTAPALLPPSSPLEAITATLFPFDLGARKTFMEALNQTIEGKVSAVLDAQAESQKRNRRVITEVGAAEMGIAKEHLLRLAREGKIKREKAPGTRRLYFRLGDLLDWCDNNMRSDGTLKYTTRQSAPGVKQKGGR